MKILRTRCGRGSVEYRLSYLVRCSLTCILDTVLSTLVTVVVIPVAELVLERAEVTVISGDRCTAVGIVSRHS